MDGYITAIYMQCYTIETVETVVCIYKRTQLKFKCFVHWYKRLCGLPYPHCPTSAVLAIWHAYSRPC